MERPGEAHVRNLMQQASIPTDVVSRYWWWLAARETAGPHFREGLIRAVVADRFVRRMVGKLWWSAPLEHTSSELGIVGLTARIR